MILREQKDSYSDSFAVAIFLLLNTHITVMLRN